MSEQELFKERAEQNILVQAIVRYIPFWPLFVITVALCMSIAYVYLRSQIPVYVAQAKVLLKDPNKGSGDSKVLDALNIFSEKKIVDNEILVLKSSNITQEVVRNLDLYASVYNQGKVRVEELYADNSPIIFEAIEKNAIQGAGKFYFKMDWKNDRILIDNKSIPFDSTALIGGTYYRCAVNPNYNRFVIGKNYFVVFNSVEGVAGSISGSINASPISNQSTVLNVSMQTPVPEKGTNILAEIFKVYNRLGIEDKNQIAAKTLSFIEDRLRLVVSQLDSVERNIANYKAAPDAMNLGSQAEYYLSNVREMDKKNSDIDLQLQVLNDIKRYVENKGRTPGTVPSLSLVSDPILSQLLGKLYDAEFQLEKIKSVSGDKSDAVVLADEDIIRIKSDILENMSNIRKNLLALKTHNNEGISENSGLLSQIPQKERVFVEISRQQAIKNNIYTYLLQKREETALSSASTIADLRVIEQPNSYGPISPIAKNFYITGLITGILLAVFIVLAREQFNSKILFRTEIEDKTKVPIVGELAQVKTKDPIVIKDGKRTVVAEQFRSLRTNLNFMAMSEKNKTMMITSSISGEGKSFIAINLAISLTLTGKKVALLEMDLRKPKLSKLLGVSRDPGISNYLIGKTTLDSIIKETSIKDLFIVSAGPIPPNPTELIASDMFGEMMTQIKERFDYVIIDTAPVGPVSDAQVLKDYADTTIFVIRHDYTPRVFLRMINELYMQGKFINMCIIFNGLKRRGFSYNTYGYGGYGGYGQGYGYGYGGYGEEEKVTLLDRTKRLFGM